MRNEGTKMMQSAQVAGWNRNLFAMQISALWYCFVPMSSLVMYMLKLYI